ncbi:MAG: tail fiber domain-containing protein [Candidatus Gracilibacteria bacterium]|nr:tail fiber domain-containing protein [Candidatus Gracilibacteria bacterium]
MTLQNGGNVGIGASNPQNKLEVNGSIQGNRLISYGYTGNDAIRFQPGNDLNPTYAAIVVGNAAWTGYPFYVRKDGYAFATSWNSSSDLRLKEDIKPIENIFEMIDKIRGVNFTWKDTKKHDMGVIAQEIEKVFPEFVTTKNDGFKTVEYGKLVAPLIEAVKELKKENEEKDKQIETLKKQNEEILKRLEKLENK